MTTLPVVPVVICKCNRCRRKLTREASRIKGIGPVCEKRGLKSLGVRASEVVVDDHRIELTGALNGIIAALFHDGEATLDSQDIHFTKLDTLITSGSNRVELLGWAYEIMADVCNQLPGSMEVANAAKHLFFIVGAPEEGDAALKRIKKIIEKVGAL